MNWAANAIKMAIARIEDAGVGLDIKINSFTAEPVLQ